MSNQDEINRVKELIETTQSEASYYQEQADSEYNDLLRLEQELEDLQNE